MESPLEDIAKPPQRVSRRTKELPYGFLRLFCCSWSEEGWFAVNHASPVISLGIQDFRKVMVSIQAQTGVLHSRSYSPETLQGARQSEPWPLRACACCLRYSYQHIFLHTLRGPVSELPIHQPRVIKSTLTFVWFIMLSYTCI